jgi:hypothetical protein
VTQEPLHVELNATGRCWACGEPIRDHTVAELDLCADMPLALEVIEEE